MKCNFAALHKNIHITICTQKETDIFCRVAPLSELRTLRHYINTCQNVPYSSIIQGYVFLLLHRSQQVLQETCRHRKMPPLELNPSEFCVIPVKGQDVHVYGAFLMQSVDAALKAWQKSLITAHQDIIMPYRLHQNGLEQLTHTLVSLSWLQITYCFRILRQSTEPF